MEIKKKKKKELATALERAFKLDTAFDIDQFLIYRST